uniref:Uncharacterized protein n=1 Tax=Romanomermis culicivorax TaxID=13658 RepID=A0A915JB81_ROMCU
MHNIGEVRTAQYKVGGVSGKDWRITTEYPCCGLSPKLGISVVGGSSISVVKNISPPSPIPRSKLRTEERSINF